MYDDFMKIAAGYVFHFYKEYKLSLHQIWSREYFYLNCFGPYGKSGKSVNRSVKRLEMLMPHGTSK